MDRLSWFYAPAIRAVAGALAPGYQEAWSTSHRWGAAWNFFTAALIERGLPTPQELLQAATDNPAVSGWRL
eukprot:1518742-Alexandrium_andersonii.AAC.1